MTEKEALRRGGMFQFPMILIFGLNLYLFGMKGDTFSPLTLLNHAGAILFTYCMLEIYIRNRKEKKLLTHGPFKYTRHPMYTGFALMNLGFWAPMPPRSILFFALQVAFFACMIVAAYFQEKETLARYGAEAEAYYAKTPRLFFFYPLMRHA